MAEVTMPETAEPAEDPLQPYAALIEAIQKPISAEIPCGEDVRYNDDFQELKTEIDGIGSLATDVDYERIVELGRTILETKSKDLTTAGFLALGLARTREVEGMAEALVILGALVETFWEPCLYFGVGVRMAFRVSNPLDEAVSEGKCNGCA